MTNWRQYVVAFFLVAYVALLMFIVSRQSGAPTATREVLCIGIVENTQNPARLDPRIQELCSDVGVG